MTRSDDPSEPGVLSPAPTRQLIAIPLLWSKAARVIVPPVLRDVASLSHPDLVAMHLYVVKQFLEAWRKLGVTNCTLVEPHGHHLWSTCPPLLEERVDGILNGLKEGIGGARH